jgi:hypothetical protein
MAITVRVFLVSTCHPFSWQELGSNRTRFSLWSDSSHLRPLSRGRPHPQSPSERARGIIDYRVSYPAFHSELKISPAVCRNEAKRTRSCRQAVVGASICSITGSGNHIGERLGSFAHFPGAPLLASSGRSSAMGGPSAAQDLPEP